MCSSASQCLGHLSENQPRCYLALRYRAQREAGRVKLSSFLEETIYEIGLGIHAAKVRSRNLVAVSPGAMDGNSVIEKSYIDFDVMLVVKEGEATGSAGKAGLSGSIQVAGIARVGVSAEGNANQRSTSEMEQAHRVSFRVPVYFNAHHRADDSMDAEVDVIEAERAKSQTAA